MDTRQYEAELAKQYNYAKLDPSLSAAVKGHYLANIPLFLMMDGISSNSNHPIFTKKGTILAKRYNRIVVGDYGAFIEYDREDAVLPNYITKPGQEYRETDPKYKDNVKYLWLTVAGEEDEVKIYLQKKTVTYADYQPGKYYVSVHEVANFVLFTHTDLDGYGAEIMVKAMYPDITTYHVNYGFDEEPEYRKIMAQASTIIFTDISISRLTAITLNCTAANGDKNLLLLDHHKSAYDKLADLGFNWIRFDETKSGALLAQEFFSSLNSQLDPYKELAEAVNDYDLWIHKIPQSVQLQFLWSKDKDKFAERFLLDPSLHFSDEEMDIIQECEDERENSYQQAVADMEELVDCDGLKFGFIPEVKSLLSLVVSDILACHEHLSYLVVVNRGGLSFRSKSYEVRLIAEKLGGGGHPLASGCKIPDGIIDIKSSIINRKWTGYDFTGGKV